MNEAERQDSNTRGWPTTEQPELKEALEYAPVVQTESLGEPPRGVNVWERWMMPNLDGQSWDLLQVYFKEYYRPSRLFRIDLGTGQVKKQRLADGHQFYLSGRGSALIIFEGSSEIMRLFIAREALDLHLKLSAAALTQSCPFHSGWGGTPQRNDVERVSSEAMGDHGGNGLFHY